MAFDFRRAAQRMNNPGAADVVSSGSLAAMSAPPPAVVEIHKCNRVHQLGGIVICRTNVGWRMAFLGQNARGTLDVQSHCPILFCPHCGLLLDSDEAEKWLVPIPWSESDAFCEHMRANNLVSNLHFNPPPPPLVAEPASGIESKNG